MAPKKKKKSAANPTRGFATTSIPSKPKETNSKTSEHRDVDKSNPEDENLPENTSPTLGSAVPNMAQDNVAKDLIQMSPEELEAHFADAELQHILDENAARVKAEAARQAASLQSERRLSRSQSATSMIHGVTLDEVAKILASSVSQSFRPVSQTNETHGPLVRINDAQILLNLWCLQEIFQILHFPVIKQALEHVLRLFLLNDINGGSSYTSGLEEAFEWFALNCEPQSLPVYEDGSVVSTQNIPAPEAIGDADHSDRNTLVNSVAKNVSNDLGLGEDAADIQFEYTDVESEDEDPDKLCAAYLSLQSSLYRCQKRMKDNSEQSSKSLVKRESFLTAKIRKIERDPLFDSKMAKPLWNTMLHDLKNQDAQSDAQKRMMAKKNHKQQEDPQSDREDTDDVDPDASLLGEMFNAETDATGNQPSQNSTLQDFGTWTGVAPRRVLEEMTATLDTKPSLRFVKLINAPFASRLRLEVHWPGVYVQTSSSAVAALPSGMDFQQLDCRWLLEMKDVATPSTQQSESYLSTLVIFLIHASKISNSKVTFRLPKVWRELFEDMISERRGIVNAEDKAILVHLRDMIHSARKQQMLNGTSSGLQTTPDFHLRKPEKLRSGAIAPFHVIQSVWNLRTKSAQFASMLKIRQQLPVYQYKEELLEVVKQHQLTVICADTGAGKSTQIPAFVLESYLNSSKDCRILVTQPRRISAISLARRVSLELGESPTVLGTMNSLVGYSIRLESRTSPTTRINFATTGVLLRMLEGSLDLDDIDCLILDEVHERTMELDLLFIAIRQLQRRRPDLRLILMSATVNASKFSNYFENAPIVNIPGRTFPVEVFYLEDAIEKTLDLNIHQTSSELFTDENEHEDSLEIDPGRNQERFAATMNHYSSKTRMILDQLDERQIDFHLVVKLCVFIATDDRYAQFSKAILIFVPGIAEIKRLHGMLCNLDTFTDKWILHMLHSSFATEDLEKAFAIPPAGSRKIVIATNIAETGITIPDVTAVIDSCKEKSMRFDEKRQLSRLTEGFISRSSARQRRGRAARVQQGLCFHLVTRYRFDHLMMDEHTPEMLRLSLQDPIMRVKIWNLGSIEQTLASAIDPPAAKNVRRAISKLQDAGALDTTESLTPLGHILATLPLDVAMGKLAVYGIIFRCLDPVITIIAMLSSKSPFVGDGTAGNTSSRQSFAQGDSDLISSYNAYTGWKKAKAAGSAQEFCTRHRLNNLTMLQIEEQKLQLLIYLVDAGILSLDSQERDRLGRSRGTNQRRELFDVPVRYNAFPSEMLVNAVIGIALYPRILFQEGKGYRNIYNNQLVTLAPSSVNRGPEKPPRWLSFHETMQAKSGRIGVFETSRIPEEAIVLLIGQAEFKLFSGVVSIDNGRIRFSFRHWRHIVAMQILRQRVQTVLQRAFANQRLAISEEDQATLDIVTQMLSERDFRTTRAKAGPSFGDDGYLQC